MVESRQIIVDKEPGEEANMRRRSKIFFIIREKLYAARALNTHFQSVLTLDFTQEISIGQDIEREGKMRC